MGEEIKKFKVFMPKNDIYLMKAYTTSHKPLKDIESSTVRFYTDNSNGIIDSILSGGAYRPFNPLKVKMSESTRQTYNRWEELITKILIELVEDYRVDFSDSQIVVIARTIASNMVPLFAETKEKFSVTPAQLISSLVGMKGYIDKVSSNSDTVSPLLLRIAESFKSAIATFKETGIITDGILEESPARLVQINNAGRKAPHESLCKGLNNTFDLSYFGPISQFTDGTAMAFQECQRCEIYTPTHLFKLLDQGDNLERRWLESACGIKGKWLYGTLGLVSLHGDLDKLEKKELPSYAAYGDCTNASHQLLFARKKLFGLRK